ncbi:MAG: CDP-diacylglycerol--glycerol-3-phosphate 3-phosphatidyltransferase [Acidobacteriota bacterium]
MGIPNLITLTRIVLIPIFMFFLLTKWHYGIYVGAAIFTLAALTDSLDGYYARKNKQVTKLGMFLDPLADKLMITAVLVSLVELHRVSALVVFIILAREFAVTGLRAIKAEEGQVIPASKWGKTKTFTQIVAIIMVILAPIFNSEMAITVATGAMWIAVVVTVISGYDYFRKLL